MKPKNREDKKEALLSVVNTVEGTYTHGRLKLHFTSRAERLSGRRSNSVQLWNCRGISMGRCGYAGGGWGSCWASVAGAIPKGMCGMCSRGRVSMRYMGWQGRGVQWARVGCAGGVSCGMSGVCRGRLNGRKGLDQASAGATWHGAFRQSENEARQALDFCHH